MDVKISGISLDLQLGVSTQTLSNGNIVPAVRVLHSNVNIPRNSVSIRLHGNYLVEAAELFKDLVQNLVIGRVSNIINNALTK